MPDINSFTHVRMWTVLLKISALLVSRVYTYGEYGTCHAQWESTFNMSLPTNFWRNLSSLSSVMHDKTDDGYLFDIPKFFAKKCHFISRNMGPYGLETYALSGGGKRSLWHNDALSAKFWHRLRRDNAKWHKIQVRCRPVFCQFLYVSVATPECSKW